MPPTVESFQFNETPSQSCRRACLKVILNPVKLLTCVNCLRYEGSMGAHGNWVGGSEQQPRCPFILAEPVSGVFPPHISLSLQPQVNFVGDLFFLSFGQLTGNICVSLSREDSL